MKREHLKKMIAPIIISSILIFYMIVYVLLLCFLPVLPLAIKIIGGVILLALIGVLVFVLTERIEEIKSGEEDDLDRY